MTLDELRHIDKMIWSCDINDVHLAEAMLRNSLEIEPYGYITVKVQLIRTALERLRSPIFDGDTNFRYNSRGVVISEIYRYNDLRPFLGTLAGPEIDPEWEKIGLGRNSGRNNTPIICHQYDTSGATEM